MRCNSVLQCIAARCTRLTSICIVTLPGICISCVTLFSVCVGICSRPKKSLCCSVLQCVAALLGICISCIALFCVCIGICSRQKYAIVVQCVAKQMSVSCSVLQCVAACCSGNMSLWYSVLQCVTALLGICISCIAFSCVCVGICSRQKCDSVLQKKMSVCCSALQWKYVRVLQYVAALFGVCIGICSRQKKVSCVAVCCQNTYQRNVVCCSGNM